MKPTKIGLSVEFCKDFDKIRQDLWLGHWIFPINLEFFNFHGRILEKNRNIFKDFVQIYKNSILKTFFHDFRETIWYFVSEVASFDNWLTQWKHRVLRKIATV